MLNVFRMSSGVLFLIIDATLAHERSSKLLISCGDGAEGGVSARAHGGAGVEARARSHHEIRRENELKEHLLLAVDVLGVPLGHDLGEVC